MKNGRGDTASYISEMAAELAALAERQGLAKLRNILELAAAEAGDHARPAPKSNPRKPALLIRR